jgi:peptidyl-prolyl cis-trans isomerase C
MQLHRARATLRLLLGSAFVLVTGLAAAGDAASIVVARVGEHTITAAAVERRLSASPGASPTSEGAASPARRVLEQVLIPELLASLEAKERGLDKSPKYLDHERETLRQALDTSLKLQALADKPVTAEELKGYFDANKSRFEQPLRLRIWRILLDDEAAAKRVLAEAKAAGTPAKWSELARDNSVDQATNLRQGDLGFVHPDGMTDAPRVRVDPALFRAAQALKDGEFAAEPILEGKKFAVLWRRGSLPAKARTLDQEKDSIRGLIERRRVEEARTELAQRLRQQGVKEEHPELLELIPDGLFGDNKSLPRPGVAPHRGLPGLKIPQKTPAGLR